MWLRDDGALARRLDEAVGSWRRGDGSATEVAAAAGLVTRHRLDAPLLRDVRARRDDLVDELADADLDALVDRLAMLDDWSEDAEVDGALFALDELGAATWFLENTQAVADLFDQAERMVLAFPEAFAGRAGVAAEVLRRAPPGAGDPAAALWRAVGAAAVAPPVQPDRSVWLAGARAALGLPLVVRLQEVVEVERSRGEAPWWVLGASAQGEVVVTTSLRRPHVVVLPAVGVEARAWVGDEERTLRPGRAGLYLAPAAMGTWRVQVGRDVVRFEVEG